MEIRRFHVFVTLLVSVYPGRRFPRTEVAVTGWSQWLPEGGTLDHRLNVFSLTVCGGEFGERTD